MRNEESIDEEQKLKVKERLRPYYLSNEMKFVSTIRSLSSIQNETIDKSFQDYGKLQTKLPLGKISSSYNRINELFGKLLIYIDKITDKVKKLVSTEEENFITAYKQEISQITKILEDNKKKINEYEEKAKVYNEVFLKKESHEIALEEARKTAELCDKLLIENSSFIRKFKI